MTNPYGTFDGKEAIAVRADPAKLEIALAKSGRMIQNVTQETGISKSTFSRMMHGENVRPDMLGRIAKALGVDVETIMASGP